MLNGFAVGWSSNISADEDSSVSPDVSMHDYSSRNDPMSTIAPVADIEYESDDGDESHILIWPNDTITPLLLLFRQNQTSWIISAFPFGVVIMSIILCKCYYYVGTKLSILSASLFIIVSWILIAFCGWVLLFFPEWVCTHCEFKASDIAKHPKRHDGGFGIFCENLRLSTVKTPLLSFQCKSNSCYVWIGTNCMPMLSSSTHSLFFTFF